jgi:hypothetical protein
MAFAYLPQDHHSVDQRYEMQVVFMPALAHDIFIDTMIYLFALLNLTGVGSRCLAV